MGGACCALAEQLMATTDDVREVADECDALLRRAAECDPRSAEPLQVMASLRAAQGRTEEALEALRQSIAQVRPSVRRVLRPPPPHVLPRHLISSNENDSNSDRRHVRAC